jgi:hypothetical protein
LVEGGPEDIAELADRMAVLLVDCIEVHGVLAVVAGVNDQCG